MFGRFLFIVTICVCSINMLAADIMVEAMKAIDKGDFKKAKSFAEQACNNADKRGCGVLSVMYREGLGIKKDSFKAAALSEKSCRLKNSVACVELGRIYEDGEGGIPHNNVKAKGLYSEACKLNDASGCVSLGFMYITGKGVKRNLFIGKDYFEKACNLNSGVESGMGCFMIAKSYNEGENDYRKGLQYADKACSLDFGLACFNLGDLYTNGKGIVEINHNKAQNYFTKGCNAGDEDSCVMLRGN